ncbi:MAG: flippase-like domain-containing protein [Alphaproteobacteria bacterium]|nr:flippase-like domain-containing protein [Alphaproteobacteria bacterium]
MTRKVAIGLIVGALALALALWGVPLGALAEALAQMDKRWLAPIGLLFLGQQAIRALRQLLIVRAVQPDSRYWGNLAVLCMAFLCINIFPARLGEVVRPYLLLRKEKVPLGAGFGVVFVERLVDLTAVLLILQAVLLGVEIPSRVLDMGGYTVDVVAMARALGTGFVLPLLVGVVAVVVAGERSVTLARRALAWLTGALPQGRMRGAVGRAGEVVVGLAEGFVDGLAVVRDPARLAAILGLTALTWGGTGFMYVMLSEALGLRDFIGWAEGMGVLVITMLGTTAPSPPGFAGVYEAASRGALALFGVTGPALAPRAVAFALVMHWWLFIVQAATAAWFFTAEGMSIGQLFSLARRGLSEEETSEVPS